VEGVVRPRPPLTPLDGPADLRWARAEEPAAQGELFAAEGWVAGSGEYRGLDFLHVRARRIINEVKGAASNLPFRFTINAYRGCSHACLYCFARPTHEYLGLDRGRDFDQRIVVKVNAAERLRADLAPSRWAGDHIAMGTNTDPYQRAEGKYRLTRSIIEVLGAAANPFSILTKSSLVLRDLDVLVAARERTDVRVNLSIGTLDTDVWRLTEPGTPHPRRRLEAVAALNEAGIPCGVLVAPILPGLSDGREQLEAVAQGCVEAGAVSVSAILLHLRPGVKQHYLDSLRATQPELAARTERLYPRANAPKADQRRVASIVHAAVRRAGGCSAEPRQSAHLTGSERPVALPERAGRPPPPRQLGLGL
jgi:DNA repair photolyase